MVKTIPSSRLPNAFNEFGKNLLLVLIFNTGIAVFLTTLLGSGFGANLTYSQSIGLSIFLICFGWAWACRVDQPGAGTIAVAIPVGPVGTSTGVTIASFILCDSRLSDFVQHPEKLIVSFPVASVFGIIIFYYFHSRKRLAESKAALQEESLRRMANEQRLTETNLKLLQAQIEPHFFFNTLSNVQSLIDGEPQKAKHMLESLTRYLRTSLQRTRRDKTTMGQELELLRAYLDIQSIRMGDRLRYEIDIAEELYGIVLPPLLIQPLVENAIKHALEPSLAGGRIHIHARRENGNILVQVSDTGRGLPAEGGSGVGLRNIRDRLRAMYGDQGQLVLQENQPSGVKASLTLPLGEESGRKN